MPPRKQKKQETPKKPKKFYVIMAIGLISGAVFAMDPAMLPPKVKNHEITQKTFAVRDMIALKLPKDIRPKSVAAPGAGKTDPKAKETGYKHQDREKLNSLMEGGTP